MSWSVTIAIIYLIINLAIGFYTMRRNKNSTDFFLAGKSLGVFPIAMATFANAISGWLFVGGPGTVYSIGMGAMWFTVPASVSACMAVYLIGKRMRLLADAPFNCMTVADAVKARYESKPATFLASLATVVGTVLFLATQCLALGTVVSYIFGISLFWGVTLGTAAVLIYSITGGVLAGIYTDVFQGIVMTIVSIVIFVICLVVGGGLLNMTQTINTMAFTGAETALPAFTSQWGLVPASMAMSWFFVMGIGIVGQPHAVTNFYMIKDVKKLKWAALLAAVPSVVSGFLMLGVGLVVRYLVVTGEAAPLARPDDAITFFINNYTHPIVVGLVVAGIASAIMSTCDSLISIASASIVRDFPGLFGKKLSDKQELVYGRFAILVLAIITIFIALNLSSQGVNLLGAFGWGTFGAALGPVLAVGMNWKRTTKQAAVASIIVGLFGSVILEVLKVLKVYTLPHGIYNFAFTLLASLIVLIVVSYLSPAPKLSEELTKVMDA
ncbi:MAG: sodium/proline symporter [Peptococcia bacterium]